MPDVPRRGAAFRVPWALGYAAVSTAFVILVLGASSGPRGSDQFWYLADTMTLLEGGPPLTNCVFPGPLLRGEVPIDRTCFAHHTLVMYLVLPFAWLAGPYYGWVAFNLVAVLATAALIALTLHRLTSPGVALAAYSVFLVLPLTVWQSANLIQEAGLALMTALLVTLYCLTERRLLVWGALLAASVLAMLCHPLYLPVAMALPFLFLWRKRRQINVAHIVLATVALGVVLFVQAKKSAWFPSTLQPSLTAIVAGTVPGQGNMEWHFRAELPDVTPDLILNKAGEAVARQVSFSRTALFYWPANLMILGSMLLLCRRRGDAAARRLAHSAGVLIALFVTLIVLHQNQYRYILIITPAILMSSAAYLHRAYPVLFNRRATHLVLAVLLIGLLAVDATIARRLRSEGLTVAATVEHVRSQTACLPADERVAIQGNAAGEMLPLSFALRPHLCLLLLEDRLSDHTVQRMLKRFDPQLVICRPDAELRKLLGPQWTEAAWSIQDSPFVAYVPRETGP